MQCHYKEFPNDEPSKSENPYLEVKEVIIHRKYNPDYGDDKMCKCGHPYYRHFDTYDNMANIGCKYCDCFEFQKE